MLIVFNQLGKDLGTRVLGQEIRLRVEKAFSNGDFVSFDFDKVELISHSFADECFGKLLLTWDLDFMKKNSTFLNTNDLVGRAIAFTLLKRSSRQILA